MTTVTSGADRALRISRLHAVDEIHNLMGRYSHLHATHQHPRILDLCALDTPGAWHEVPFGIYDGRAGLERLYVDLMGAADEGAVGSMHLSAMTTPVIEVAADGRTARGVWMSPGHATDERQGRFVGRWRWLRFAGDFTVENGTWKIWHLRLHGIFATPYDRSWVETAQESEQTGGPPPPPSLPSELAPDRPPHLFWVYGTRTEYDPEPLPPEPYETWS